jgi:hypothetical protein
MEAMASSDRIAEIAARLSRREVREFFRAIDLFEYAGIWTREAAHAWRDAVWARAAELSEPHAEA